jgi:hypothetical protein
MHRGTKVVLRSNNFTECEVQKYLDWAKKQINSHAMNGNTWLLRRTTPGGRVVFAICELFSEDNPAHKVAEDITNHLGEIQNKIITQEKFKETKHNRFREYIIWTQTKCLVKNIR